MSCVRTDQPSVSYYAQPSPSTVSAGVAVNTGQFQWWWLLLILAAFWFGREMK